MTKQISATVATDRPTSTLESHVSNRQMRWTSARGKNDLNAQPNTYAAQRTINISTRRMPHWTTSARARNLHRSDRNSAMLAALTSDSVPHHTATGFDHVSQSKFIPFLYASQ